MKSLREIVDQATNADPDALQRDLQDAYAKWLDIARPEIPQTHAFIVYSDLMALSAVCEDNLVMMQHAMFCYEYIADQRAALKEAIDWKRRTDNARLN